ncbi:MAG: bifunctional nuclease family protein [Planctomycetota bacterium]|nr:bifunctional nuclease family protein [Planctomycetota bacterium]
MAKLRMELARLVISENSPEQIIFLRETEGQKRGFSIRIGVWEALAIDRKLRNTQTPRPMTHDLLENVLKNMGAKLTEIVVTQLKDDTFYAKLVLSLDGKQVEVDARPSDAIALAIHMKSPIYVEEEVLTAATPPD